MIGLWRQNRLAAPCPAFLPYGIVRTTVPWAERHTIVVGILPLWARATRTANTLPVTGAVTVSAASAWVAG